MGRRGAGGRRRRRWPGGSSRPARLTVVSALVRARATAPQGASGAQSRRANVAGAFRARRGAPSLAGADAWLVDDVVTSGATAESCAEALRAVGARAVYVLCVARAGTGA